MILCVEAHEYEQCSPDGRDGDMNVLDPPSEDEMEHLSREPPVANTNAFIDLGGNFDWDACGASKYGLSSSREPSRSEPRSSDELSADSGSTYEESPKKPKRTKSAKRVPTCRRSVPLSGKGKGKGKRAMEKARRMQMKRDAEEKLDSYDEMSDSSHSEEDEEAVETKKKPKKSIKKSKKTPTSDATTNPIGVGAARKAAAKGKGKGKGKRKGPGGAYLNRYDNEPFSDEGEMTPDEDRGTLDEDFDEGTAVGLMPELEPNAPREDEMGVGIEDVTTFHDLEWGGVDDTQDRDRVLKGKPSWGGSETPGTTRIAGAATMTLIQLFLQLFPLAALDRIVIETNLYASIAIGKSWYPNARKWTPLTTGEFMVWIGICIGMGVFQLDNYTMFWSGLRFGAFVFPDITGAMPMRRWEQIKRYLHLKSNVGRPAMDTREGKLWQCEWLEKLLTASSKLAWNPTQDMCMDERSVPSRHKFNPIKVFNPNKPHKFACNQQSLVDSKGYQYHSWFYDRVKRVGLKIMIVHMFCKSLPHRGFKLAADRWYGSTNAPQVCAKFGHSWTSTLIKSYVPQELKAYKKSEMESGESHFVYCEEINACITVWKDKNIVYSISNELRPYGGFVSRNVGAEVDPQRPAPEMVVWYNAIKAMVDGFDGKCLGMGSLEMAMTSHKWWHCMFFALLDGVLVNLDIIARSVGVSNDRLQTLMDLSTQLQSNNMDQDVSNRTRRAQNDDDQAREFDADKCTGSRCRFVGDHFPSLHPSGKQGECIVCRANNFGKYIWMRRKKDGHKIKVKKPPSKPRQWCERCGVHLCVGKCFEDYHKKSIEHLDHGLLRQKVPPGNVGIEGCEDEEI